jgi:hypothetical protein
MTYQEKLEEMTFTELLEGLIKACDIRIEELEATQKPKLLLVSNDD